MLDAILGALKRFFQSRLLPISLIYIGLFAVIIHRLFVLQIIQGPQIAEQNDFKRMEAREIKSTRGLIYDRNGVLLASNTLSYSVVMEDTTEVTSNSVRNALIHNMVKIIERNGDTLYHDFPIIIGEDGNLEFTITGSALTRFKKNAYAYALVNNQLTEEQTNATAREVYDFLRIGSGDKAIPMFGLTEEYSVEDTLKIMSIRYALFINYPKFARITVANNVSERTVATIMESAAELPGVSIQQQTQRYYEDSVYFAHILGYTGLINSEELETLNAENDYYNSTDIIGKSGIEKELETYLSGKKGVENVSVAAGGKVVDLVSKVEPLAGNNVYLTIDSELQKETYHILERNIAGILLSMIQPDMNYGSKGESASDILIPIYEVYYALINNNIIDITQFDDADATDLEATIYNRYLGNLDTVFTKLTTLLSSNNTVINSKAGAMEEFLEYYYEVLKSKEILLINLIPSNDTVYQSYLNDRVPLSTFIHHALTQNYIDLSKLGVGDEYYSSDELYDKLMRYMRDILAEDGTFNKKIYRDLVFSYKLSGKEICLLLFDQGVLEYNEDEIIRLRNGIISAYDFMRDKISSLAITPAMLALEPCSGSVVVTDVTNGDVLALVTYPSYDNNKLANKVDPAYYSKLLNDKSYPLINRPASERTAPGSTFKMVSSFAALGEGVIGINDTIRDLALFDKIDPPAKCHIHPHSHGAVDLDDALKVSCNYYYYEVAYRMSIDRNGEYNEQLGLSKLGEYVSLFGLDAKSGIEINESQPRVSTEDPVRSSIGQGSNAYTPVQISRYVTTIANRGTAYNLTLVDKIKDKDGKLISDNQATVYAKLDNIKASHWDVVQDGMYDVVNTQGGSLYNSRLLRNIGVTVAGKTGTSQISKVNLNNALFVSFAPYENPEISVTTVIPNGSSSSNAARITKDVYEFYYKVSTPEDLTVNKAVLPDRNIAAFSD